MPALSIRRPQHVLKCTLIAFCLAILLPASDAAWARPSSMKLFPEESLVFVRAADAREVIDRFKDTSIGRMVRDPQLQPFVENLYGRLSDTYAETAEATIGLSLDQLQQLPQGEIAFALVPYGDRPPSPLVLVDFGEQADVAQQLLEAFLAKAREEGSEISTETIAGVEVTVLAEGGGGDELHFFIKEDTFVAAMVPDVLREVLRHWAGDISAEDEQPRQLSGRTLAENSRFSTILRHSRRPQDPPPQLLYYVDPIGLFREIGRGNPGMQMAVGMLPALGLDGLLGLGGTWAVATGPYDDLSHFHVLLDNPRAGVLRLMAFETGDMTPPPWVPHAMESYMSWYWDFLATYDRLAAIIDRFRSEGATDQFVKEVLSERLGVDVLTDVLGNLTGRVVYVVAYDTPPTMRSQRQVMALEVADEALAAKTLETIRAKYPDLFEERQFGKATYYALMPEWMNAFPPDQRPMEPMVAIQHGCLFIGSSCQLFEKCVAAGDGTTDRLVDSEDYHRIIDTLGKETSGTQPTMLVVSRFAETLRHWYSLLTSEQSRQFIDERAEDNPLFAALAASLDEHELPPFDVLEPYTAPAGGIFYDTDSGVHAISFTLRNDAEP